MIKQEIDYLLKARQELISTRLFNNVCKIPFDINYIVNNLKIDDSGEKFKKRENVITIVNKYCDKISKIFKHGADVVEIYIILIKFHFRSKIVMTKKYSINGLITRLDIIYDKIIRSVISPGELIGASTGTSIASNLTQLTLNTFHLAGVGSESAVVENMDALLYILRQSKTTNKEKSIKYVNTKIYLNNGKNVNDVIKLLTPNKIEYFVDKKYIINDSEFFIGKTIFKKDRKILEYYIKKKKISMRSIYTTLSKFSLRVVFNLEKMYEKKISLSEIALMILKKYPNSYPINLGKNVLRIYMSNNTDLNTLQELYDTIDEINITGIPGIYGVTSDKQKIYKVVKDKIIDDEEFVLFTKGTNLSEIYNIGSELIDLKRTISTDISEIYNFLGIEAARQMILERISLIFMNNGISDFNREYFHFLSEFMTHSGMITKINIIGAQKTKDIEILQKLTYERSESTIVTAALNGEKDNLHSTSANILFSQIGKYASGICELMINNFAK